MAKSIAKGAVVGLSVMLMWAALDWLSAKVGLPFNATRSYSEAFFAAAAGASVVFISRET